MQKSLNISFLFAQEGNVVEDFSRTFLVADEGVEQEEGGYDELEKAFQDNDIEQITEILRETNGVVKRNMRREVPVDLDPPLQDYYFRFLRMSGQDEVIEILDELWNRDPGTFYNNA